MFCSLKLLTTLNHDLEKQLLQKLGKCFAFWHCSRMDIYDRKTKVFFLNIFENYMLFVVKANKQIVQF